MRATGRVFSAVFSAGWGYPSFAKKKSSLLKLANKMLMNARVRKAPILIILDGFSSFWMVHKKFKHFPSFSREQLNRV